jgi:hypothetical protein
VPYRTGREAWYLSVSTEKNQKKSKKIKNQKLMALNKPNLPEGRGGVINTKIKTSGLFPVPVAINGR